MGGGLLQLVAYGAQDVYLTGNPQITLTASNMFVNYIGLRLLKSVTIEIGGQQIDKHYSDWLYIWNELSLPIGKRYAWEQMVGADQDITSDTTSTGVTLFVPLEFWFCRTIGLALPLIALQYHEVKLKIEFEAHNNCIYQMGTAGTANDTIDPSTTYKLQKANLWVDYIFLDTDERRKFAQLSHEYLIEQLQFTGSESLTTGTSGTSTRVKLNFNHPCKELVWVAKYASSTTRNHWYNYTVKADGSFLTGLQKPAMLSAPAFADVDQDIAASSNAVAAQNDLFIKNLVYNVEPGFHPNSTNPFERCLLQLNGNDRFAQRDGSYFNYVQPFQHHTNIPANQGINVYSFALKPEEHQPSGTLNMSRIDTAVLAVDAKKSTGTLSGVINIYATNYNVLRILSGMGGLAYSN